MADSFRPDRRSDARDARDARDRGDDRGDDRDGPSSRSPSPAPRRRRTPPPARPRDRDRDRDRDRQPDRRSDPRPDRHRARDPSPPQPTEEQKQAAAKAEYNRLLNARSGGVYVPPARLRALQAQVRDKTSKEYQRMAWEALKKSINGLVNKATAGNMRQIINELFAENLVRGRGLLAQSLIKAQYASLPFTPVYACIAACVNSKLPAVGELLLRRLLLRFRKGFRRNDKAVCRSATTFLAHLVNTQVADEMIAAQMLMLLLHHPTDDSVEIAVGLTREVGNYMETMNPTIMVVVFDRFHHILNEADIDKRTQYAIEVLFQNRKDHFADQPAVRDDLDLIEEEDQIKHMLDLNGAFDDEPTLNIFRYDEHWEENEKEYAKLRREILNESDDDEAGSDSGSGSYSGSDSGSDSDSEDEVAAKQTAVDIKDRSNADLVALRRTIYLTIQSSMNADEAVHKLLAVPLPEGREAELPSMVVECCSQEKTYTKFFGLLAERLAKLNRRWTTLFEEAFTRCYETIHRYETNRLRNVACLFGHLLASDAIGWYVLGCIHLTEDETTSASRIFIKILFQEMAEAMGMPRLQARLQPPPPPPPAAGAADDHYRGGGADPLLQESLVGLFPRDDARHLRFAINYFTSIGMGALTEGMRERLQNLPKPAPPAAAALPGARARSGSGSRSRSGSYSSYSSSYTGSSYSYSRSRSPASRSPASRSRSRTPRRRSPSPRSPRSPRSPVPRRSYSPLSRSPSPRTSNARGHGGGVPRRARRSVSSGSRSRSVSRSVSPPPRRPAAATADRVPSRGRGGGEDRGRGRGRGRGFDRGGRGGRGGGGRGRAASYSRSPTPSRGRSLTRSPPRRRSPFPRSPAAAASAARSLSRSTMRSRSRSPRSPSPGPAAGAPRRRRRSDSGSGGEGGSRGGRPRKHRRS